MEDGVTLTVTLTLLELDRITNQSPINAIVLVIFTAVASYLLLGCQRLVFFTAALVS